MFIPNKYLNWYFWNRGKVGTDKNHEIEPQVTKTERSGALLLTFIMKRTHSRKRERMDIKDCGQF